jgi:arsenate reductase (thioredoxin)
MGCGDVCPVMPGKRYLDWDLADPSGQALEPGRTIREQIIRRVDGLVERLDEATPVRGSE